MTKPPGYLNRTTALVSTFYERFMDILPRPHLHYLVRLIDRERLSARQLFISVMTAVTLITVITAYLKSMYAWAAESVGGVSCCVIEFGRLFCLMGIGMGSVSAIRPTKPVLHGHVFHDRFSLSCFP